MTDRERFLATMLCCIVQCTTVNPDSSGNTQKTIWWDPNTLVLVAEGGYYGRMVRLDDGQILCAFERAGAAWVTHSRDDGQTWTDARVAATYAHGKAANPELLKLANGWLLLMVNERPTDGVHSYAIRTHLSKDGGHTWSERTLVYEAGTQWENGCWEPAAIQLASGEILLFFANEEPYPGTNEQEISLARSRDDGLTWSKPVRVSFRPRGRDGMPVPLLLAEGLGLVIAIEDSEPMRRLQPTIVSLPMAGDGRIQPTSSRRWRALREELAPNVYAGAPYLQQFPSGETVLSCQSDEDRSPPVMVVYVGDSRATSFTAKTVPFTPDPGQPGHWNSLFIKGEDCVTALSGTTINGRRGLWAIDGRLGPGRTE